MFSGKVVGLIILFIIPIILVRLFSKAEYGLYLQFLLICNFFSHTVAFTFPSSLYYFFPKEKENHDIVVSQTFFMQLGLILFFIPIYIIFINQIISIFNLKTIPNFILLSIFYISFSSLSLLLNHIFVVEKKSNYVIRYEILNVLVRLIFILIAVFIYKTVIAIIWSLILFNILRVIILSVYLNNNYKIFYNLNKWNRKLSVSQIKYTYPLGLANIVNKVGSRIDRFILAMYFSASDFAVYSISQYRIPVINLIFPSVSNVIIPEIVRNKTEGKIDKVISLWHKLIITLAIITIPSMAYFFLVSEKLILFLYTDAFIEAVPLYRIILLSFISLIFSRSAIITAFGKTKYIFYSQLLSTIFGIVLGFILVKEYGSLGAAITFTSIFFFKAFVMHYISMRLLKLTFYNSLPWKKLIAIFSCSIISSILLIPIIDIGWNNLITLIISFILYVLVLSALYHLFRVINLVDLLNKFNKWKMSNHES